MEVVLVAVLIFLVFASVSKKPAESAEATRDERPAMINDSESEGLFLWDGDTITALTAKGTEARSVVIPEKCRHINENVFSNSFVGRVEFLGNEDIDINGVFRESNVYGVTLPQGLSVIGAQAFCGDTSISHIDIPQRTETIGKGAFQDCTSLNSVTFSGSLREIRENAFRNTAFERIELPDGLEVIGNHAFSGCGELREVIFPDSVKSIGLDAFGKTKIENVTFPGGVELSAFDVRAFGERTGKISVYIREGSWMDTHREYWGAENFKEVVLY